MLVSKTISWDAPVATDNVTQTIVQTGINASPFTTHSAVASPAASVVVNLNALVGDTLHYRIIHSNASGNSLPSTEVQFIVPAPPVPAAPTGLIIS